MNTCQEESGHPGRRREGPTTLRRELALTAGAIVVTIVAAVLATADILVVLGDRMRSGSLPQSLAQVLFLIFVSFLIYGECVYEFARLGHLRLLLNHCPAPETQLTQIWGEQSPPALTILVPSYKEEAPIIRMTLLSAALQEYPQRRLVLLIDDPPHPTDRYDLQRLAAARRVPEEVLGLLDDARKQCEFALEGFLERRALGQLNLHDESARLAQLYRDVAAWFEGQANQHEILDHVDRLFVQLTFLQQAQRYRQESREWADGSRFRLQFPNAHDLFLEYRRLLTRFQVEITSFERKRYVNLSHEPNKAMNLNSYIGLMGKRFREIASAHGVLLAPNDSSRADLTVPDADFVLMVDADSVLSPDYALRLTHFMRQPGNERVAVAQTPYSAFPGAQGIPERIAAATTDVWYFVTQGLTQYRSTFWVGANAVVRKTALEDIAERGHERGHAITRFVQDRTVIEDTEASIDLIARDWSLYNYPERLSFSGTPPDFGSLLIQRRRWANGGLIILPKLFRYLFRHAGRPGIVGEGLMRFNYLASLAIVNIGLPVILASPFEHSTKGFWLPFAAIPYFGLYVRDLRRAGYTASDMLRVYALNLALIPVNLGGTFRSVYQVLTGRKTAFGRTPKIKDRTRIPPLYLVAEYALLVLCVLTVLLDALRGNPVQAAYVAVNAGFLSYAIYRFIGPRESWADLNFAWSQIGSGRYALARARLTRHSLSLALHPVLRQVFLATAILSCLLPSKASGLTEMAITVDDLPTHGAMPKGTSRLEIAQRMVRDLRKHRAGGVYGFVNGKQVQDNPEHLVVLEEWVQAGLPLGNHTFSHMSLDRVTPSEYIADIAENERFLSRFSQATSFKPFRYPYLAEGDSLDKRNAVRAWLAGNGYRVAQVTVNFEDWAWNDPYVRCLERGDVRSIEWLKRSFIEVALIQLRWSVEAAHVLLKRPIKHILGLHIGVFDSIMFDELLTAYEGADVAFIDLEGALRDPIYNENPDVTWERGLSFLDQLARAKRLSLPPAPEVPLRQLDTVCR